MCALQPLVNTLFLTSHGATLSTCDVMQKTSLPLHMHFFFVTRHLHVNLLKYHLRCRFLSILGNHFLNTSVVKQHIDQSQFFVLRKSNENAIHGCPFELKYLCTFKSNELQRVTSLFK